MAKGFAYLLAVSLVLLSACSKKDAGRSPNSQNIAPEPLAIESSKLTNCHFKVSNPTYSYQSTIAPNPIQCDDGVPRKVELLTPTPLPNGIQFAMNLLSLTGVAGERVINAPYEFYLENEAGYVMIKLLVTVK